MRSDADGGDPPATGVSRLRPRRPRRRSLFALAAVVLLAAGIAIAVTNSGSPRRARLGHRRGTSLAALHPLPACGAECDPIDPAYLTDLRFGASSFWIQPWRAYLDTWPASRLTDAVGINFNVPPRDAPPVARLLHDSGFRLARVGTNWGGISYADPHVFSHEDELVGRLTALRENGLRPLIVLDANSGAPCPSKPTTLELATAAGAGARTITLTAASAAEVVPGKTGFGPAALNPEGKRLKRERRARARAGLTREQARALRRARKARRRAQGITPLVLTGNPSILITSVRPGGVATLSRPLPLQLPAGPHRAVTLRYAPFAPPTLPGGRPDPEFAETMHGWIEYVRTVTDVARRILGPGGFDLEVWNELGFGSQFLDASKYYSPAPAGGSRRATKDVTKDLLRETIRFVRDPASGLSAGVGVSNGFASQSPFPTPAFAPAGLTALSKHPYAVLKSFPQEFKSGPGRVPYDALGARDTLGPRRSSGAFTARFVPRFESLFPEFFLTALSPETLVRDVAPITTRIYRAPHGRDVSSPHGGPLQVWVTEYNLGFRKTTVPVGPDGTTPQRGAAPTAADKAHFQAKALLRSLVAMVAKGVRREYFYAATGRGNLAIVSPAFMSAVQADPSRYPGDALGGESLRAFRSMLSRFAGPGPGAGGARQLHLDSISQFGGHVQFQGDGSAAHPSLRDRDVLAVFPFQSSPTRFTIPVYVMTRDLLTLYRPAAPSSDIRRFDLPDERFRVTLSNLPAGGSAPAVSLYDPLRERDTPVRLVARSGSRLTVEIAATDYPRILTLRYPGS